MLLPSEKLQSVGAIGLMQSVLDDVEERGEELRQTRALSHEEKMVKAQIKRSEELRQADSKISDYFFSEQSVDPHALLAKYAEKLGEKLGVEQNDGESAFSFGRRMLDAINDLTPTTAMKLEKELGLSEVGLTLEDLANAFSNPYSAQGQHVEDVLVEANDGQPHSKIIDGKKVIERLENIAKDRSIEEMKVDLAHSDAGEVEDPEELKADIDKERASEKLEQVQKLADVIGDAIQSGKPGEDPLSNDNVTTLLALAGNGDGATEMLAPSRGTDEPVASQSDDDGHADALERSFGASEAELKAALGAVLNDQAEQGEKDATDDFDGELIVQEGEDGVYKLLRRKSDDDASAADATGRAPA